MFRLIEWLWGHPLGKFVAWRSFRPSWDASCRDWGEWGIAWPMFTADEGHQRRTSQPIWNWIWLRNRLGIWPPPPPTWPQAM